MTAGNIASHLKEASVRLPDEKAILSGKTGGFPDKSFLELYRDVKTTAAFLKSKGVGKGDKTLLFVRSGYELIVLAFSLFFIGAVPIIIDPGMGLKSLLRCIQSTRPSHMVGIPLAHWVGRFFRKPFQSVRNRILVHPETFFSDALEGLTGKDLIPVNSSPDELAAIVFTSGSTGPPKGVCYMNKTFNGQIRMLKENFGMQEGEVDMATLPIFALFNPALGITTVIPEMNPSRPAKASAESLVETLQTYEVTTAFASPVIGRKIAHWCMDNKTRLPLMKRFFLAGAPSPPQLVEDLASIMENGKVIIPYGSTEALPISFCDHLDVMKSRKGTEKGQGSCLGKPLPGVSIKLFPVSSSPFAPDPKEVQDDQVGEICVAGPTVTEEYYRMPGATLDSKFKKESKTYHRMGDLGYFDVNGNLRFLGRKAERIETSDGPLETEKCEPIVNSIEGVRRSSLIGIGRKNPMEACIVVEPKKGFGNSKAKEILRREILDKLRNSWPKHNIEKVFFEKALPVDARHNAKIHRLSLAKKWTRKLNR
tara:strand:+ start:1083 stop:2693 length:1611 start_codon:yes stop_codon:yes gene_type:complete